MFIETQNHNLEKQPRGCAKDWNIKIPEIGQTEPKS